MASQAEKRRNKKLARSIADQFALAPIQKAADLPRAAGRFTRDEDARRAVLDARCMKFGIPSTKDSRRMASAPHMGCVMGFLLQHMAPGRVPELWQVWQAWASAEREYRIRYIGQGESAQGAAIGMVQDIMETDQSHSVDARSSDERDRDAVSNWMRWQGYLGHLHACEVTLLHHARREDGPTLWDIKPTQAGMAAFHALVRLAYVVDQRTNRTGY